MSFYQKADGTTWFREGLYHDFAQEFLVEKILVNEEIGEGIAIQRITLFLTSRFGLTLAINDVIQTTEADEAYYHEPLVHCAANSLLTSPSRALLIGCDGGTLREVVRYASLKEIVVVEIDPRIIEFSIEHLPFLAQGAFDDKRAHVVYDDGALYAKKARDLGLQFDLIIIDSPDDIGCAHSLFTSDFYTDIIAILSDDGVVIRQTGSGILQPDETPAHVRQMLEIFEEHFAGGDIQPFVTAVPTYVGGYFMLVAASRRKNIFRDALAGLEERVKDLPLEKLIWYSAEQHRAAMSLPPAFSRLISQIQFGRHLVIDLYSCNPAIMASVELTKKFLAVICREIKMVRFGDPIIPDFGHGKSRTAGLSAFQLIETSAVSAHHANHWRIVCEDIFTCAELDLERAVQYCMKHFEAVSAKWLVVDRGTRLLKFPEVLELVITERDGEKFKHTVRPYLPSEPTVRISEPLLFDET